MAFSEFKNQPMRYKVTKVYIPLGVYALLLIVGLIFIITTKVNDTTAAITAFEEQYLAPLTEENHYQARKGNDYKYIFHNSTYIAHVDKDGFSKYHIIITEIPQNIIVEEVDVTKEDGVLICHWDEIANEQEN